MSKTFLYLLLHGSRLIILHVFFQVELNVDRDDVSALTQRGVYNTRKLGSYPFLLPVFVPSSRLLDSPPFLLFLSQRTTRSNFTSTVESRIQRSKNPPSSLPLQEISRSRQPSTPTRNEQKPSSRSRTRHRSSFRNVLSLSTRACWLLARED